MLAVARGRSCRSPFSESGWIVTELQAVEVAQSPEAKFEEFLGSRGLKLTKPRRAIVRHVFDAHEHFEAEDLVASLRRQHGGVSRSTVYRTLALLVEAGLLRALPLETRTAYEHDYGYPPHDHLYCQRCGKLIEFVRDELRALRDAVSRDHNFRPTGHRLVIFGTCADCNRARVSKRRLDLV